MLRFVFCNDCSHLCYFDRLLLNFFYSFFSRHALKYIIYESVVTLKYVYEYMFALCGINARTCIL